MKVIIVPEAKEYVDANYPNDPLLKAMANAMLDRLPSMDVEEPARWIPVTEQLPEEDTRVLVWLRELIYGHSHMDTDRLHKNKFVRWGEDVTHWMPLPQAPKEV